MGFFSDLKEDLSQAVNELMPEEELDQAAVEETKEQPVENTQETTEETPMEPQAEERGKKLFRNIIGAVWVRIMDDYGHIEDGVPSFAISLYEEYRGLGIGTALMKQMLAELMDRGYRKTSLAVQKANYAVKMYLNVGFQIIDENEEEYIMVCEL